MFQWIKQYKCKADGYVEQDMIEYSDKPDFWVTVILPSKLMLKIGIGCSFQEIVM